MKGEIFVICDVDEEPVMALTTEYGAITLEEAVVSTLEIDNEVLSAAFGVDIAEMRRSRSERQEIVKQDNIHISIQEGAL